MTPRIKVNSEGTIDSAAVQILYYRMKFKYARYRLSSAPIGSFSGPSRSVLETSCDRDTTYQGRKMGIKKVSKENKDMNENNKTENIG